MVHRDAPRPQVLFLTTCFPPGPKAGCTPWHCRGVWWGLAMPSLEARESPLPPLPLVCTATHRGKREGGLRWPCQGKVSSRQQHAWSRPREPRTAAKYHFHGLGCLTLLREPWPIHAIFCCHLFPLRSKPPASLTGPLTTH